MLSSIRVGGMHWTYPCFALEALYCEVLRSLHVVCMNVHIVHMYSVE